MTSLRKSQSLSPSLEASAGPVKEDVKEASTLRAYCSSQNPQRQKVQPKSCHHLPVLPTVLLSAKVGISDNSEHSKRQIKKTNRRLELEPYRVNCDV